MANQENTNSRNLLLIGGVVVVAVIIVIGLVVALGGSDSDPDSTPEPAATATITPDATGTALALIPTPANTTEPTATLTETPLPTLTPSGTPEPTPTPTVTPTPLPDYWEGAYFGNPEFDGEAVHSEQLNADAIDLDWGNSSPVEDTIEIDFFSARWTRCFEFEERYYVFFLEADDQARVMIDDAEYLSLERTGSTSRPVYMSAGVHCARVEFVEYGGQARVKFYYTTGDPHVEPPEGEGWNATYYADTEFANPVLTRRDAAVNFSWQTGNPAPGIGFDNFSVEWDRCADFEARAYTFTLNADDEARLFIDGDEILTAKNRPETATLDLTEGEHCLRIAYNEFGGQAHIALTWE